ncbi:hypothetical protein BH11PSE9_BH11PSE9_12520 [soil metagenome]
MSASAAQSHLRYPLTRLLGNSGNIRVLRALLAYDGPLSAAQLARDAGLTPQGVRLVLDGLVAQGVVTVLGQPRSQLFTLVATHPFAGALATLFAQERARWDEVHQALSDTLASHKEVRSAWLYGSAARGEDAPHSDVDLALVVTAKGSNAAEAAREALRSLGDRLHLNISVTALTPGDVAALPAGSRWWAEMSRDAKLLKGVTPEQEAKRCARKVVAA